MCGVSLCGVRRLARLLSASGERSLHLCPAEALLGMERVMVSAQHSKIVRSIHPAARPSLLVIELEERASRAAPSVGRGEGALQAIALHHLAAHVVRDVRARGSCPL